MINTRDLNIFLALFVTVSFSFHSYSNPYISNIDSLTKATNTFSLNDKNSTNREQLYQQILLKHKLSKEKKDTLAIIQALIDLSNYDRSRGDYDLAFDKLWESLTLSEIKTSEPQQVLIYRNLGILYDIFNKDSTSLEYLKKSIHLSKKQPKHNKENLNQLTSSYFSVAMYWRVRENYHIALKYLDSCTSILKNKKLPYILADRGYCNLKLKKIKEAKTDLYQAKKELLKTESPYQAAIFYFLGDLKVATKEKDSALIYYQKSLNAIEKLKVHIELKPEVLQKMAEVYHSLGTLDSAYRHMRSSKDSYNSLFGIANKNNERLFEIKNKYKESLLDKELFITEQADLIERKNKERIWLIISLIFIVFITTSIYIINKQRNKLKKLDTIKQFEIKKNIAVIATKNKELTTYSLQLVEKEQAIKELLATIKKHSPQNYNLLKQKHKVNSIVFWEDFNRRFLEINNDYYSNLLNKHPKLTATEQKHCALIKLNLDSIEMAALLNISLQSVHTSRYRIKKKMGLTTSDSLENYIREL
ncbi:tetratricopeptide repeat protein [Flavicella sediminum]|uniref:tetratricopeptide repeat protein n=1 Tax=Flavicella sediminum TaxID=2585141 RepID=UPI0011229777|nr:hypothetical protein [Flavicella sediminum]